MTRTISRLDLRVSNLHIMINMPRSDKSGQDGGWYNRQPPRLMESDLWYDLVDCRVFSS